MTEPVDRPAEQAQDERPDVVDDDRATAAATESPEDASRRLQALVDERTEDLKRVQAEYINYKKRVDRDRSLARQAGAESVLRDLMPVFDSIVAAGRHDELAGGFKLTADELTRVAHAHGLESFGEPGDEFDPRLHEALMQVAVPGTGEMTVKDVMQVGYRIGDQVVRPARVVVAVPDGTDDGSEAARAAEDAGSGDADQARPEADEAR
ncbi:hypothetical protein GCM10009785_07920 [Brooklawnia cerclae]|uniref:Protein GrpE n=1 Tax=Brooklawnia cerclae TaxID=349934 RepID=A0ABX0SIY7_9ACTN|nr:molecular chaperone GrpE [Brooklawnia cerclae]